MHLHTGRLNTHTHEIKWGKGRGAAEGKNEGTRETSRKQRVFSFNVFTCNYVHGGGIMQVKAVLAEVGGEGQSPWSKSSRQT